MAKDDTYHLSPTEVTSVPSVQTVSGQEKLGPFCSTLSAVYRADTLSSALEQLMAAINHVISYEQSIVLVYTKRARPTLLHDTFAKGREKNSLSRYISSTYVLNPVYNAFLAGLRDGIHRITEIAPDGYQDLQDNLDLTIKINPGEELGYRTVGWPKRHSELILSTGLPTGELLEICLLRDVAQGFSDHDVARVQTVHPLICEIIRHHVLASRTMPTPTEPKSVDDLALGFGADRLSTREHEVVHLVLRGHSTGSIAHLLNVAVSTIKSHRKNIYRKLNVGTQQELFSQFISYLEDCLTERYEPDSFQSSISPPPLGG